MSDVAVLARRALFGAEDIAAALPVCDHYAGVEARMRKSLALQAELGPVFDITLDAEDGAPVGGEAEHAELIASMLVSADNRFGRVGARLHPVGHASFRADVTTIVGKAGHRVAYVMVPKVEGLVDVDEACEAVDAASARAGIGPTASPSHATSNVAAPSHAASATRPIPIHVLIETHGALREVAAIAAHPRVESLSFGLMDFVSAHRGAIPSSAMSATGQFSHPLVVRAKLEIAAACHGFAKTPSHCVVTEFADLDALARAATRASREFGFTRMWSIHPAQIRPIVAAFAPSEGEIDEAVEIIAAASNAHWAPIRHRDTLHDRASYRYFWNVIERARRTGRRLPADAMQWFGDPAPPADRMPSLAGAACRDQPAPHASTEPSRANRS